MSAEQHGPVLTEARRRLGERRLNEFIEAHARLQAMTMFLVMSVHTAPAARYADDYLNVVIADANDVERAAKMLAHNVRTLAKDWRAQRQEFTRSEATP